MWNLYFSHAIINNTVKQSVFPLGLINTCRLCIICLFDADLLYLAADDRLWFMGLG